MTARQILAEPVAPGRIEARRGRRAGRSPTRTPSVSLGSASRIPAVAVDQGRDPGVDRAGQGDAVLDGAEDADGQVHVVLRRAVEPAVVGEVQQDVGLAAVGRASAKNRRTTWGTVSSKQMAAANRKRAEVEPGRPRAEVRLGTAAPVGGQRGQPGEGLEQRDVLAERDEVELVVALDRREPGLEEDRRVVLARARRGGSRRSRLPTSIGTRSGRSSRGDRSVTAPPCSIQQSRP